MRRTLLIIIAACVLTANVGALSSVRDQCDEGQDMYGCLEGWSFVGQEVWGLCGDQPVDVYYCYSSGFQLLDCGFGFILYHDCDRDPGQMKVSEAWMTKNHTLIMPGTELYKSIRGILALAKAKRLKQLAVESRARKGEIWHNGLTVTWWANTKAVEVRVNAPDGDLFASSGPECEGCQIWGSWGVGKPGNRQWAVKGVTFYLQDVSEGKALVKENTIAKMEW